MPSPPQARESSGDLVMPSDIALLGQQASLCSRADHACFGACSSVRYALHSYLRKQTPCAPQLYIDRRLRSPCSSVIAHSLSPSHGDEHNDMEESLS